MVFMFNLTQFLQLPKSFHLPFLRSEDGTASGSSRPGEVFFRKGDTVRVYCKGERGTPLENEIFEGVVSDRRKGYRGDATFTVQKGNDRVSVQREFRLFDPRITRIVVTPKEHRRRRYKVKREADRVSLVL